MPDPDNTVDCIPAFRFHVVGTARSDPTDGTPWVGSGDSHANDVIDELSYRPYDETSYAGKILHVDRDGRGLPGHPYCPADDNLTHVCTKVYAKGFRNPFRFTLRPGKGPVVGNVGHRDEEEVDLIEPGTARGRVLVERSGNAAASTAGRNKERHSLDRAAERLAAGETAILKLRPKGDGDRRRKTRRTLKRLVKRGRKARAKIQVEFADRAGNSASARLIVRLRRK